MEPLHAAKLALESVGDSTRPWKDRSAQDLSPSNWRGKPPKTDGKIKQIIVSVKYIDENQLKRKCSLDIDF